MVSILNQLAVIAGVQYHVYDTRPDLMMISCGIRATPPYNYLNQQKKILLTEPFDI